MFLNELEARDATSANVQGTDRGMQLPNCISDAVMVMLGVIALERPILCQFKEDQLLSQVGDRSLR